MASAPAAAPAPRIRRRRKCAWSSPPRRSAPSSNGTISSSTARSRAIIGAAFFPPDNATLQLLLAWAGFAVGFGFRPLGAILFGYLGDRLGRKYTFLVTITLMGVATAAVGLVPTYGEIGIAAPLLVIFLRILQGLALGGEYGGAAIYVAEHAPPGQARLLHQLHPGERGRRLRAQPRGGAGLPAADPGRGLGRLGLARAVPVLARCCSRSRCGCG